MSTVFLGIKFKKNKLNNISHETEKVLTFAPSKTDHFKYNSLELFVFHKFINLLPYKAFYQKENSASALFGYGQEKNDHTLLSAETLTKLSFSDIWKKYYGEWSAAIIKNDCLITGSSSTTTCNIFITDNEYFSAVSNRSRVLWNLLFLYNQPVDLDFETLSYLLTTGHAVCTNGTSVKQVKLIESTKYAIISAHDDKPKYKELKLNLFNVRKDVNSVNWSQIAKYLTSSVKWLHNVKCPIVSSITGGKDSRLVLSILKGAGLEKKIDFFVWSPKKHADRKVADILAKTFGLRYKTFNCYNPPNFFNALKDHTAITEGMLNPWDIRYSEMYKNGEFSYYPPGISIFGFFGECYRKCRNKNIESIEAITNNILSTKENPIKIVKEDVIKKQQNAILDFFSKLRDSGIPLDRMNDVFYLSQRLSRWLGAGNFFASLYGIQFNPLFHPEVIKAYYQLPLVDKKEERIPFEIMYHLSPNLVKIPFAESCWNKNMVKRSSISSLSEANEINYDGINSPTSMLGQGWQIPTLQKNWKKTQKIILDNKKLLEPIININVLEQFLKEVQCLLKINTSFFHFYSLKITNNKQFWHLYTHKENFVRKTLGLLSIISIKNEIKSKCSHNVKL